MALETDDDRDMFAGLVNEVMRWGDATDAGAVEWAENTECVGELVAEGGGPKMDVDELPAVSGGGGGPNLDWFIKGADRDGLLLRESTVPYPTLVNDSKALVAESKEPFVNALVRLRTPTVDGMISTRGLLSLVSRAYLDTVLGESDKELRAPSAVDGSHSVNDELSSAFSTPLNTPFASNSSRFCRLPKLLLRLKAGETVDRGVDIALRLLPEWRTGTVGGMPWPLELPPSPCAALLPWVDGVLGLSFSALGRPLSWKVILRLPLRWIILNAPADTGATTSLLLSTSEEVLLPSPAAGVTKETPATPEEATPAAAAADTRGGVVEGDADVDGGRRREGSGTADFVDPSTSDLLELDGVLGFFGIDRPPRPPPPPRPAPPRPAEGEELLEGWTKLADAIVVARAFKISVTFVCSFA